MNPFLKAALEEHGADVAGASLIGNNPELAVPGLPVDDENKSFVSQELVAQQEKNAELQTKLDTAQTTINRKAASNYCRRLCNAKWSVTFYTKSSASSLCVRPNAN
jgi:hypothetical protein